MKQYDVYLYEIKKWFKFKYAQNLLNHDNQVKVVS